MLGVVQNRVSHAFFRIEIGYIGNAKRLDFLPVRNRETLAVADFLFVDQVEQRRHVDAIFLSVPGFVFGNGIVEFFLNDRFQQVINAF